MFVETITYIFGLLNIELSALLLTLPFPYRVAAGGKGLPVGNIVANLKIFGIVYFIKSQNLVGLTDMFTVSMLKVKIVTRTKY